MGIEPSQLHISARFLENRVPIVAPNVWIEPGFQRVSVIATPVMARYSVYPIRSKVAKTGATLPTATVNPDELGNTGKERLYQLKPDMYEELDLTYSARFPQDHP